MLQAAWLLIVGAEGATSPLNPLGGRGGFSQLVLPSSILPTPPRDRWSLSQTPLIGAGYAPVTRCGRAVSVGVSLHSSKTYLEALPFSLLLRWSTESFPGQVLGLKTRSDLLLLTRDPRGESWRQRRHGAENMSNPGARTSARQRLPWLPRLFASPGAACGGSCSCSAAR